MKKISATLLISFIFLCSGSSYAITPELRDLLNAKSLQCQFNMGQISTWESGKFTTENVSEKIIIHYDDINVVAKRARMIGNNQAAYVSAFATEKGLNLTELTPAGSLVTVTVFPHLQSTGNFSAVMSRHISALTAPIVSQWVGSCFALSHHVDPTP